jgi:hypothetical protein
MVSRRAACGVARRVAAFVQAALGDKAARRAPGRRLGLDMEHWVWPLPPAGPFAFVCEWPSRGIAESRAEIDAGLILEAAGRAVTLWPDD